MQLGHSGLDGEEPDPCFLGHPTPLRLLVRRDRSRCERRELFPQRRGLAFLRADGCGIVIPLRVICFGGQERIDEEAGEMALGGFPGPARIVEPEARQRELRVVRGHRGGGREPMARGAAVPLVDGCPMLEGRGWLRRAGLRASR